MRSQYSDEQLRVLEKPEITCDDFLALLGDYADEDLPASLKARLDNHTLQCSSCEQFKQSYMRTVSLAGELRDKPIPSQVQNRLRQALNSRLGLNLPSVD